MSIILDALRRGRGRTPPRGAASAAQTDAVLQTLGYGRLRTTTRLARLRRLVGLLGGAALVAVMLWATVVWLTQTSVGGNSSSARPGAAGVVAPASKLSPLPVINQPPPPGAVAQSGPAAAASRPVPSTAQMPQSTTSSRSSVTQPVPAAVDDLIVQPSRRAPVGAPPSPAVAPSRKPLSSATSVTVSDADHFRLALYYQRTGDFENALIQYRAVLQRDPLNAEAHNNLGLLYRDKNLFDEAVKEFQAAIAIDQRYVKGHNNLGVAYLSQRKSEAAAAEFKTALALDPKNVESLVNLALADKEAGRRDDARALLTRALDLDPRNAEAHYNLALLADELGDRQQALAHYRAFLQYGTFAHPELAAEVSKRIETLGR
jgi:Tfp pilus assembly protein PilF